MINCIWKEEDEGAYWSTACGHAFTIVDSTPSHNGMEFCCYCGNRLDTEERPEAAGKVKMSVNDLLVISYAAYNEIESHLNRRGIGYLSCKELAGLLHIDKLGKDTALRVGQCLTKSGHGSLRSISDKLLSVPDNSVMVNQFLSVFCKCCSRSR